MSMMDAMNMGGQPQPQQPMPGEPTQPQPMVGEQAPAKGLFRMADGNPEEMKKLYGKLALLIAQTLWEQGGSDQVSQAMDEDDDREPSDVIGTYTAYYLTTAIGAARTKGGMVPPVIIVALAADTAAQLTDLAIVKELVEPKDADDTADAGALIGLEIFMKMNKSQLMPEEFQEYSTIIKSIIDASPHAMELADEGGEEALENYEDLAEEGDEGALDEIDDARPVNGGIAAAMGQM